MRGILNDVVLAPFLAKEMANDRHCHRKRQAVRVGPDFLRERPRCLHQVGERKTGWRHSDSQFAGGIKVVIKYRRVRAANVRPK
jgi:hypothetical protein